MGFVAFNTVILNIWKTDINGNVQLLVDCNTVTKYVMLFANFGECFIKCMQY